jgi:hypothetical protein
LGPTGGGKIDILLIRLLYLPMLLRCIWKVARREVGQCCVLGREWTGDGCGQGIVVSLRGMASKAVNGIIEVDKW